MNLYVCMQSGLAQAPPKTNRKLRKERKNRAKKVSNPLSYPSLPWSDHLRFQTVPRYQEGQGGRAPQEGQVMVGRIVSSPGFLASHFMHIRTSQKLFAAAVSYHLCPLSLFLNAHDNYAHADNASLYSDAAEPLPCRPLWRGRLEECVEDVQDSIRSAHYMSGIIAMKRIWSTDKPARRTNERS